MPVNIERGVRRLIWVISVLASAPFLVIPPVLGAPWSDALIAFALGVGVFALVWGAFFAVRWIVQGFSGSSTGGNPNSHGGSIPWSALGGAKSPRGLFRSPVRAAIVAGVVLALLWVPAF